MLLFGVALGIPADGDVAELDAVEARQGFGIGVIADDRGDGAVEFPGLLAVEEVHEAVEVLGDEDGDAGASDMEWSCQRMWRSAARSNSSSAHSTRMK